MTQKTITVTASTGDQRTLGAISRLFAELASGALLDTARTAAATVAEFKPAEEHEMEGDTAPVGEAGPEEIAPSAPSVDTAKVFGAHTTDGPLLAEPVAPPVPPAPPVPEAPAAQVPTPPAAPTYNVHAVEVDKAGLPWDDRINTSNKAKTEKGIWKMRKGLPAGVYDAVVAELKGVMALGTATGAPVAPAPVAPVAPAAGAPVAPPVPIPPVASEAPAASPVAPVAPTPPPAVPVAPVPPVVTTTPAEAAPTTYAQFIVMLTGKMQAKLITGEEISAVCQLNGLPSLTQLANAPQLVGAVYEGCKAVWSVK